MVQEKPAIGKIPSLAKSATTIVGPFYTRNCRTMALTIRGTTNASATLPIRAKLRFSPDAVNYDTVDYTYFDLDLTAGSATQETHLIDCPESGYMNVFVENTDTSYAATDISVWVRIVRWSDDISKHDEV